ncbi:MAG TPA: hypothetical protein PKD09_03050 [Aggregatilinea sp.]|jgi:hypothetical protein|uniref:hypothetical protein n=1 Tax=Aggregatilinea sp. TaxID=2806333 RepID=UPI002D02FEBE|nr:hypothetical protein [Aggregatilinea sp.]HML20598.1 hypothetical protein [Aggregatilinea sp.]
METALPLSTSQDRVVDVIDRAFRIYRSNFFSFVLLFALVTIPFYFAQEAIVSQDLLSESTTWAEYYDKVDQQTTTLRVLSVLNTLVTVVVGYGLTTYIASEAYMGRKINPWRAFRECKGRLFQLGLAWLSMGFIFGISAVLVVVTGVLCWIPFILLPVVMYLGLSTYFFLNPVMVLENVGPSYGIRRAVEMGKTHFWPVFGLVLGLWLITFVIEVAFGSTTLLLSTETTDLSAYSIASIVLSIVIGPLMPIGLTMMYYHYRIRYEGLDLALQASDVPNARPRDLMSPDIERKLVTSNDIVNMVMLVVVFVILLLALYLLIGTTFSTVTRY